jgi:hypothetical protein
MTSSSPPQPDHPRNRRFPALVALALMLAYLIPATGLILSRFDERGVSIRGYDERRHHHPTIERFSEGLPTPDLSNYPAAMTPGYHLSIAVVHRLISKDLMVLRLAGSAYTAALIGLFGWLLCRSGLRTGLRAWEAGVLALPVITSVYVFPGGVWLVPDNAGWLFVLLVLALALTRPPSLKYQLIGAAVLVLTVIYRQPHIWAAGLMWLGAWLGDPDRSGTRPPASTLDGGMLPCQRDPLGRKVVRTLRAIALTIPALLVLGWFVWLWDGFVPPLHQPGGGGDDGATMYEQTFNPTALGFAAMIFGVANLFFAGYLLPRWISSPVPKPTRLILLGLGAGVGLLLGVLPESSPTIGVSLERASGFWNLIARGPIWLDRSPIFAAAALLGGVAGGMWMAVLPPRQRWLLMGAVVGIALSCATIPMTWQRYSEPLITMVLALNAAIAQRPTGLRGAWRLLDHTAWIGPLLFAGLYLVVLLMWFIPG